MEDFNKVWGSKHVFFLIFLGVEERFLTQILVLVKVSCRGEVIGGVG